MANDLNIKMLLPATPKQVMQLMTDQEQIKIWSGEDAVFEAKEGGAVSLFDGWMKGTIEKINDNELIYTCTCGNWEEGTKPSRVSIALQQDGAQTKFALQHTGLPDEEEVTSQQAAWQDFFLTPFEDYLMVRFNKD